MKILCVGQVEDSKYILEQIAGQTRQPDWIEFYIDPEPVQGLTARRKRITENHQRLIEIVNKYPEADFIWQVEGDSELPKFTLELLVAGYLEKASKNNVGYISGIQVGRHGLYCLGAWHVAQDLKSFWSANYLKGGIVEIDATGWYCLLAPKHVWLSGVASWNNQVYGPDVNWGLSLDGYKKYVDMDLHIGHRTKSGVIRPSDASTCNAKFYYDGNGWVYKQYD